MIHASVFSGIGGPEVAAAMLGWENAFHCEINPFGRAVLEYWFPESKSYEDITKTNFREWRGRIDVLSGGFPCQPFSYAGKRGGRNDDRYLWPQMLRVIDEVRPTWVVGENVAGITTMVEGGVLTSMGCDTTLFGEGDGLYRYELRESFTIERICSDLEGLGYSVQPVLIPAAAVGAPHRRDRVFILAHAASDASDVQLNAGAAGYRRDAERQAFSKFGGRNRADASDTDCGRSGEVSPQVHSRKPDGDKPLGDGSKRIASNAANIGCWVPSYTAAEEKLLGEMEGKGDCPISNLSTPADGSRRVTPNSEGIYCDDAEFVQPWDNEQEQWSVGRSGGQNAANSNGSRQQESEFARREKNSKKEGAGMDDRAIGSRRDGCFADSRLLPGNKWHYDERNEWIPTVSPVHSGNDGLPIRMDGASIPFTKWRTESLKAYGNAIVPQVMYEIFRAIQEIES